jgi:hypothetical protein
MVRRRIGAAGSDALVAKVFSFRGGRLGIYSFCTSTPPLCIIS